MTEHDHSDHEDHAHGDAHAGHSHGPGGHHHAPPAGFDGAFALGAALNGGFVVAEVVFGIAAHSVVLLADAAHNLGDVLGLLLAWGATVLGRRRPTRQRTYGYGRSSILASLTNAVVVLVGVGAIAVEAIQRLVAGVPAGAVGSTTIIIVAAAGIVINGVTAWLFARGRKGDLNVRAAFLHMAADALVSLGVVVSGVIILFTGWVWVDPAASLIVAALILVSTWSVLRDSVNLALDKVPEGVDVAAVQKYLVGLPGISEVHDLHVWGLSTTETALTVHLVRPNASIDDGLLHEVCETLKDRFAIGHSTIQVEDGGSGHVCALASESVI
ncbi:cation diffusion facilitator family transporter [Acidiphilium acidophilum]|uniref:cation diffusion facilitator family transporter n=1 Tax=Acidiphilium acidophilum TaxID=76588 RepID=UPI002E8E65C4|nr:cation diffusion facilitator family transporter [Acidiphilium acidophilum]